MFENINSSIFFLINGGPSLAGYRLSLGVATAEWLVLLVPMALLLLWIRGNAEMRAVALRASLAVSCALLANWVIGQFWYNPRPFVVGMSQNVLQHAADSSFPSDHATFMFTVAFVLVSFAATRAAGVLLCTAALATAWARVYVGVHYPLDMVGAMLMAACMARLVQHERVTVAVAQVLALVQPFYRRLLAEPIRRGWLRP